MCEVSRPRPRRISPIWGRAAVGLGIGLGWSVFDGWPRACRGLLLVAAQGERLGSARARLSIGQGDCLSAIA
ncbi:hypothetical protein UTI89UKE3_055 [Escherichia phage vB_EcoP-UTI89UKE3]|uniref:Uncharacterized protein n=1 Tax=Escherichia phage vB_EcoP-UTI89UKE2 TaxID=2865826 RepID=A0AAE7XTC2_9CAUD|nr:hypothetical protein UTI89UKE2_055 [Escherichia phage vB_EcoP-UTI89UKE2]QZI84656.1 hypothetical protein UTI89UKE3_055 [Escherichia phage vB_EcoP-UTI89UKE3]